MQEDKDAEGAGVTRRGGATVFGGRSTLKHELMYDASRLAGWRQVAQCEWRVRRYGEIDEAAEEESLPRGRRVLDEGQAPDGDAAEESDDEGADVTGEGDEGSPDEKQAGQSGSTYDKGARESETEEMGEKKGQRTRGTGRRSGGGERRTSGRRVECKRRTGGCLGSKWGGGWKQ
ncbi:hypothetical protein KFL_006630060 [Klebsormidium nitens]|uniref:Uncharacterized protein n=1 Tax=Klebsormidium nitens TaxID=105231 RepID=A0A1Y1IME9_KLENI|nr:hypothetical protein KFL_006630060 [Klebsormidium nitens]|eukprot:GAQ90619.1 hypothetical protein KFL_006630060 [Klebsormidium nitens]